VIDKTKIKSYLEFKVNSGELTFGFNNDIKEFSIIYIHENIECDYLAIDCKYMDGLKLFSKSITLYRSRYIQYLRDEKISLIEK
jgi:hypothetical protein